MSDEDWLGPEPAEFESSPALPGSRIQVVEKTADRVVLFIPGGGSNSTGLGCFAIIWNGFMTVFTGGVLVAGAKQANGPPWPFFLVIALFWTIGLTMAWFAIKMRYERLMLLVDRSRAVLQRTLFNRVKTEEADLAPGASATLVESYKQNDRPVYAVTIEGVGRTLKFGTGLSDPEKDWIVDHVNELLGVKTAPVGDEDELPPPRIQYPEKCGQCGASLGPAVDANEDGELVCTFCGHVHRGEVVEATPETVQGLAAEPPKPLGPFPSDKIVIEEQSNDRLVFSMKAMESVGAKVGLGCFFTVFAIFWNSITWGFVAAGLFAPGPWFVRVFMLLFSIPFVGIGLFMASLALFVWFGRLRVMVDREQLAARWGAGLVGYTRRFPTDLIDRVAVEFSPNKAGPRNARVRGADSGSTHKVAIVWSGGRWIPLTVMHDTETARHVARLVRDQLDAMQIRLGSKVVGSRPAESPGGLDDESGDKTEE